MITDDELMQKIDQVSGEFHGQIDHFFEAVGSDRRWAFIWLGSDAACIVTTLLDYGHQAFGDPKP